MQCGWDSPEQIAACIHLATRWFGVLVNVVGLGSFALIALLVWLFRRLRRDLARWEDESKRANELRRLAEDNARQAEHRVTLAEREAARNKQELETLRAIAAAGEDSLRRELVEAQTELSDKTHRLEAALNMTSGGTERFWSQPPRQRFEGYTNWLRDSIPVLLFGNQKGGVGKSTLVTNLGAAFANMGERVLTVDIDYQGSHSSLFQLQIDEGAKVPESLIDFLFEDTLDPNWFRLTVRRVTDSIHYIPAFYSFEPIERKFEYRWALGYTSDDVRYRLARALLAPELQRQFDRILIDAPPRFTLGFVNGFCAATHLYVPTVVDQLSASAVASFARQFKELKAALNPRIQWAAIIGTLTFPSRRDPLGLTERAEEVVEETERIVQALLETKEALFIRKPVIVRDADLAYATDKGVAYLIDSEARPMFDELAAEIAKKAPRKNTK
jgi:chromosome partitioning protein